AARARHAPLLRRRNRTAVRGRERGPRHGRRHRRRPRRADLRPPPAFSVRCRWAQGQWGFVKIGPFFRQIFRGFPSPLWGGAGGGGRSELERVCKLRPPPSPALPPQGGREQTEQAATLINPRKSWTTARRATSATACGSTGTRRSSWTMASSCVAIFFGRSPR